MINWGSFNITNFQSNFPNNFSYNLIMRVYQIVFSFWSKIKLFITFVCGVGYGPDSVINVIVMKFLITVSFVFS